MNNSLHTHAPGRSQLSITNFAGEPQGTYGVQRIICIGRNYPEHAREMGHDPALAPPFYFFKPITALAAAQGVWPLPAFSTNVHHELELVIALQHSGRNLQPAAAQHLVAGFSLGLDMTCRDIQQFAKAEGRPWDTAKGFDFSAPCTPIVTGGLDDLSRLGRMELRVNHRVVQEGHWSEMQWPLLELLSAVSRYTALGAGDLIFTGTPAGVGQVVAGDRLLASMAGFPHVIDLTVEPEA